MKWESVLVVDDDQAFCALMASHLERYGYDVESCSDGLEALDLLRAKGPFQVMVTDLSMPGMNGLDLLRKARKLDPDLEVIVITAAGSMDTAIAAMREDGAYDYLTKPLDMIGELSLAVGRAMAHRRLNYEKETLRGQLFVEIERLRALAGSVGEAVIIADGVGTLVLSNVPANLLVNRPIQQGLESFTNLPEPLVSLVNRWQADSIGQPLTTEVALRKDLRLAVSLTPIRDVDDKPGGWIMVMQPKK